MKLDDFDFDLPDELIATRPANPRSSARLLHAQGDQIQDLIVTDLVHLLRSGDRLVLNDTRVIPARLFGYRTRKASIPNGQDGQAKIEVTLLQPNHDATWTALIKPLRKVDIGETIEFDAGLCANLVGKADGQAILEFNLQGTQFDSALEQAGAMPLPPYIAAKRPADERDRHDYQTVWAKNKGSVAAPTASLHFDEPLLEALSKMGVQFSYVTLHVGAGTFLPVKVDDISKHKMHSEIGYVSHEAAQEIAQTKAKGGRVIPVGTTALRLIETAARENGIIEQWQGATDIFIYPGFKFNIADGLMTNFHLPKSTLLMLVSALMGTSCIRNIYNHAVKQRYRFFSYGDASLLFKTP